MRPEFQPHSHKGLISSVVFGLRDLLLIPVSDASGCFLLQAPDYETLTVMTDIINAKITTQVWQIPTNLLPPSYIIYTFSYLKFSLARPQNFTHFIPNNSDLTLTARG